MIPVKIPRKQQQERAATTKRKGLHFGITVRPIGQGEYYGFCLDGDHLFVLGDYSVTHNTSFMASEVSYFAEQCKDHVDYKDKPIVWINNEEEGRKVKMRIMQAALGCSSKRMMNDPQGAARAYAEIMGDPDRIIVYDNKRATYKDIEKFLAQQEPCIIVYDQLRKVGGFEKAGSEVLRLQHLYGNHARAMASEYGAVLTVHQARGDAEGQL